MTSPAPPDPPRVLVVEDDASVRKLVLFALGRAGFEAVGASNGREAMAHLRERPPAAIVCDLFMPDVSGLELIPDLLAEFGPVPIVAVSGGGYDSSVDALAVAERLGARSVLRKPFSAAQVVAAVRAVLA